MANKEKGNYNQQDNYVQPKNACSVCEGTGLHFGSDCYICDGTGFKIVETNKTKYLNAKKLNS